LNFHKSCLRTRTVPKFVAKQLVSKKLCAIHQHWDTIGCGSPHVPNVTLKRCEQSPVAHFIN